MDRAVPCPPTDGLVPWQARCQNNVGAAEKRYSTEPRSCLAGTAREIAHVKAYPDTMLLREAGDLFFARSNLGPDGGYTSRWVRVETKPLPFYFPNWSARVAAARLHDLHHIATNYQNRLAGGSGNLGLGDRRWLRALLCSVDSRSERVGRRAHRRPAKTVLRVHAWPTGENEFVSHRFRRKAFRPSHSRRVARSTWIAHVAYSASVGRRCVVQLLVSARRWFVVPIAPFCARAFLADRSRMLVVKSQPQYL